MAQLVRALACCAEGPRIEICTEKKQTNKQTNKQNKTKQNKKKKKHIKTDWLRVLCAWAMYFTLICLVDDLSASGHLCFLSTVV